MQRAGSAFVGRDRELAHLNRIVQARSLVTITGVGGVGKTRLAQQALADLAGSFRDGVMICELARERSARAVPTAVASQLGFASMEAAAMALADAELLVLLDNCEQVLDAATGVVSVLLGAARSIRVLATSREPLGLAGEYVLPIEPLSVPDADDVDEVARSPAAQLFLDRAHTAGAAIDLETQAAPIAELCRRLDGLPLALELAAARSRTLTPAEIERHVDRRFALLARRRVREHWRHQSLRAALDWSYDLLSESDRRFFDALGVFDGDFTLEAAHQVARIGEEDPIGTLARVDGLVQRSLVTVHRTRTDSRYGLLETLREYARDRLGERGELDAARDRYIGYLAELARRLHTDIANGMRCPDGTRLLDEYDTLRHATSWCIEHDASPDRALALFQPQWVVIHNKRAQAVAELGERLLRRRSTDDDQDWLTAAAITANAWVVIGDTARGRGLLDRIVPVARKGFAAADTRRGLAMLDAAAGRLSEALRWVDEGALAAEVEGMLGVACEFAGTRAQLLHELGRSQEALEAVAGMHREAELLASGNLTVKANIIHGGIVAEDDPHSARMLMRGAVDVAKSGGPYLRGISLRALGAVALIDDDIAVAADSLRAALAQFVSSSNDAETWWTLRWIAALLKRARREAAAELTQRIPPPAPLFIFLLEHQHRDLLLGDLISPSAPPGRPEGDLRTALNLARRELTATLDSSGVEQARSLPPAAVSSASNSFVCHGEIWVLTFGGQTVRLKNTKGLRDIAGLLANPGREVHCLDLMGSPVNESDMGPVIDQAARRAYQRRARELQAELDDAEAAHDLIRAEQAREELEALIDQLTAATGLGGRARRSGASAERARLAVRWRIRAALSKIAETHPDLGEHLERSIRTGTWCVYEPADALEWELRRAEPTAV